METPIEDINEKGSDVENPSTFSNQNQNAHSNAVQDTTVSRAVSQGGSRHPYCQIQDMLGDAEVMIYQAGRQSKKSHDATLKTAANYIKRIILLLPYYPVPKGDGRKWYHIESTRGGIISLSDVSIFLSQAVDAIRDGGNVTGILEKAKEGLADLIEAEMQIVGGISK